MELVFKGQIVKNWMNAQHMQTYWMRRANKMIAKLSMVFYSKAQIHRNKILHDNGKYREYVIEWYSNLVEAIEKGSKPSMKKYMRKQKLDMEKCNMSYIRLWNMTTTKMMKEVKDKKVNDIRNYFSIRQSGQEEMSNYVTSDNSQLIKCAPRHNNKYIFLFLEDEYSKNTLLMLLTLIHGLRNALMVFYKKLKRYINDI